MNKPTQQLLESYTLYSQLIDEADADTIYQCLAEPGCSTSEAKWRIKKIVTSGNITTIAWADGDTIFDNIADNRYELEYK